MAIPEILKNRRGGSLPIVLAVMVAVVPLSMSLILVSGLDRGWLSIEKKRVMNFYKMEGAILQKLYGGRETNLPLVSVDFWKVWSKACTFSEGESLCAIYGIEGDNLSSPLFGAEALERFQKYIRSFQEEHFPKDTLFGNRIITEVPRRCVAVENGDVVVRLNFSSGNFCLFSSGDIRVEASGNLDSMFLYGGGNIHLQGEWRVLHLEAHASEEISLAAQEYSGILSGKKVTLGRNSHGKFPSVAIAYAPWGEGVEVPFDINPRASFFGTLWNTYPQLLEYNLPLSKNIQGNFIGFSTEKPIQKSNPLPSIITNGQGKPIIWAWQ